MKSASSHSSHAPANRSLTPRTLLAAAASLALLPSVLAQPVYTVTDLGVLPGHASSTAKGLNDRGEVVGYCAPTVEDFNQSGFVWKAGTMIATGKLAGGHYSTAMAINSRGAMVGDADTGNFRPQGWVTSASGLLNFFPNNGGNTHALFISDTGWIGGYYTKSLSGWVSSWKAAIWMPDAKKPGRYSAIDLPILPGGVNAKASTAIPLAFNQAGQATGYAQTDLIGQHACFWNNNASHSIVDLGVLPGDSSSLGYGINSFGQVAGESHPPFGSRAIVWNNDSRHTPSELPLLAGDNYGGALAINNLGHVLGYSAHGTPGTWDIGPSEIVIWRDGGVFSLQSLLDPVTGGNWTLLETGAINNAGQIVATGIRNGITRALLLTPQR